MPGYLILSFKRSKNRLLVSDLRVNRSCGVTVGLIISCNYFQCGYIYICDISDRVRVFIFFLGTLNTFIWPCFYSYLVI